MPAAALPPAPATTRVREDQQTSRNTVIKREQPVDPDRTKVHRKQRTTEQIYRGDQHEFQRHDDRRAYDIRRALERIVQHDEDDQAQHQRRLHHRRDFQHLAPEGTQRVAFQRCRRNRHDGYDHQDAQQYAEIAEVRQRARIGIMIYTARHTLIILAGVMASNKKGRRRSDAKLWSGRFTEPVTDLVKRFTASVTFDQRLAEFDIRGSLAHARMLQAAGILSRRDLAAIRRGMARLLGEVQDGTFPWSLEREDVHLNIERRLTDLIGDAGRRRTPRVPATTRWQPTCGFTCARPSTGCWASHGTCSKLCWGLPKPTSTQ
jgi:hypothetical protein